MPSLVREVRIPGKSAQELYDKVSAGIDKFMEKAAIGHYDVQRDPAKKEVYLKASMVTATLSCTEEKLVLDAKLSLLATPFRAKIDEGINKWISKTFGIS
ncbi:MAG: polyhydroxyalkanoic acid system family protein [Oligoflexia bacterium]|nr:polyhydroxyalkanoic acid system family protein [Oligoflexia bacterium]